jgi:hypothetical protein
VAQLVARVRQSQPVLDAAATTSEPEPIPVHADYAGRRTRGLFYPGPGRIEITTGELAGETYRTPTAAARAVVHHHRPEVSPHRNGWNFWLVSANSTPLQTIRHRYR